MALQRIAFYLMRRRDAGSAFAVVSAKNPVHSVLFLIAAFFSSAGSFVLLGAEFLAMLLWSSTWARRGAVLFVVIDAGRRLRSSEGFARYMPLGC